MSASTAYREVSSVFGVLQEYHAHRSLQVLVILNIPMNGSQRDGQVDLH